MTDHIECPYCGESYAPDPTCCPDCERSMTKPHPDTLRLEKMAAIMAAPWTSPIQRLMTFPQKPIWRRTSDTPHVDALREWLDAQEAPHA